MAYVPAEALQEPLRAAWLKDGGAKVSVNYRGAWYERKIPRNGYVTHSEAGALLRVRRETVWRWVQSGKLKPFQIRGVQVVSLAELRELGLRNGYPVPA